MGREKRRSNIYKSFEPTFLKDLEFREVLLEFWEISRGAFW